MWEEPEQTAAALQNRVVAFVRAFGLHRPEQTPCGAQIPVSQAHAISVLAAEGALSQKELARHLELTKSTVSRLVGQLEQRGLIVQRADDTDARRRLVELTTTGHDTAVEIAELRRARLARLLRRIPEDDRTGVLDALDTLIEAAHDTND
ncbi:MAG: MarR family winged helix-turn-helix transcriptional regulator [Nitriliruptoraceae bacterium]